MPTLSSTGIGSGLDVSSIIDGLMAVERRPLDILQSKYQLITTQISSYGELISSVSSFNTSVKNIGTLEALDIYKATSSDKSIISISSSDLASAGTYSVEVTRLAEQHKLSSIEILSTDTFGGTVGDAMTIQLGDDVADSITINLDTAMTLSDIRDAINDNADNPGFTAALVNGNDGMQKLVLTAAETGSDNVVSVSYGGTINPASFDMQTLNDIGGDFNLLNSEITVDGYTLTRQGNSFDDVITGISFDLLEADPGTEHTLTVAKDTGAATSLMKAFANAYNELRASISEQRAGSLGTDSILYMIENQIANVLNTPATGGTYSVLSEIGLTIQKDGTMKLDTDVLASALEENPDAVAALLAADGEGFASRLATLSENWISSDGLLNVRTEGLNGRIDDISDRQEAIERRLTQVEARYRAQFSALDTLVSQFQNTSQFLTAQLAQLPSLTLNNQ